MLQWTGGSRRKVYASRKSTQSRQRQYFEQKKRQQQQNQNDVAEGQPSHDKEPRSLDVLNISNLATPSSHHNRPANAEGAIPQLDFTLSDASPTHGQKNITSLCNTVITETGEGSQPRLSPSFGHQDIVAVANSHEQPCKIYPSINYSTRQQNQKMGLESEISLIDLASYEGSKNKSTARPAREAHVSFSVKGLGHIKMETPPHSPISTKRDLPLPPKAMRFTHKAKRSIPFDVTKALDSMNSINVLNERRPPDKISKFLDESDNVRRKQFNCYFPDSSKNHNADLNLEDEDMFYEPRATKDFQSKRSRSGGNLADENSDTLWTADQLNSKDYFPASRDNHFDTVDYGCKDIYSPERRNSTRSTTRFDNTGIPSSHNLFSEHSLMDDKGTELFEWERKPPSKKISNSNISFGPSAWPFDMGDDSERKRSPISEESCSSAAALKDRPCKKPSPSAKNEMNKKDEFHMSLDELDIPNMDAHLHGMSLFNNPKKVGRKLPANQKKLETDYWPESTEQPRTREPSCRLSLEEKFSSWGSPTSHLKGSTGQSTVMHEDKPYFKAASDMGTYQTESTEKRPAPKVHSAFFHGPDNVFFEDDIHMEHPMSDIFGDNKNKKSNLFRAKDLQIDIDMGTLFGHDEDRKQEDNFATLSNRNVDIFLAKKATSSVRQTVGGHSICSQPSGTDSFRHGFTPGFSFQESEPNTFWEDSHVSNGTFSGELSGHLAREKSNKIYGRIETSEKPDTKMLTKTCQLSPDHRNETRGAETCSDGSEVSNYPEVQKDTCAATKQTPANISCLQETSSELFKAHARASEKLDDPSVDYEAPLHLRNKTPSVVDQSEMHAMFQSPFVGEVGIEKKIITSVSPNNSDVQYQFMLEQRVLQRLCVQKIVVPTPMKDKLDKDKRFRITEDGSHVLAKSV